MNKFAALTIFIACLGVMAAAQHINKMNGGEAASSSVLVPTDQEETAKLGEEQQIFADYCIRSRDYVKSDFKDAMLEFFYAVRRIFNIFTPSYEQKELMDGAKNFGGLACERTFKVESQLKADFEEFKLANELSTEVAFESVRCLTSQRVLVLANNCRK